MGTLTTISAPLEIGVDVLNACAVAGSPAGKIFMELWDKLGETRLARTAYEITGERAFAGTTDGAGRLLHERVPNGLYRIAVAGRNEDSAALVLESTHTEPQIRFLR